MDWKFRASLKVELRLIQVGKFRRVWFAYVNRCLPHMKGFQTNFTAIKKEDMARRVIANTIFFLWANFISSDECYSLKPVHSVIVESRQPNVPFVGWYRRQIVCGRPFVPLFSFWGSGRQPPRGVPWKLSSQLKQISTLWECSWGGKRLDSRPWRGEIPDANTIKWFIENID